MWVIVINAKRQDRRIYGPFNTTTAAWRAEKDLLARPWVNDTTLLPLVEWDEWSC